LVRASVVAAVCFLTLLGGGALDAAAATCGFKRATIVGTPGADRIVGTPRADVIQARGGNDVIRALGGEDTICGQAGSDRLYGGRGSEFMIDGGRGTDVIVGGKGHDSVADGRGADVVFGGLEMMTRSRLQIPTSITSARVTTLPSTVAGKTSISVEVILTAFSLAVNMTLVRTISL
jgi:hypothetical protein